MSNAEWMAMMLSLRVSLLATLLVFPFALAIAWALARLNFRGKGFVSALVHMPLVLPPVVTGYFLLILLGKQGPIGSAIYAITGLSLAFTWVGAAIAAAIMALPLMVRTLRLAFEAVDPNLEQAAFSLGAPKSSIFMRLTLPLIAPGALAAAVLGWAKAMGEFGATITFVANIPGQTQTLPLAIHSALQVPGAEFQALRLIVISVILSFGAIWASDALSRRVLRKVQGQ